MTAWSADDVSDLRRWSFSGCAVVLTYAAVTAAVLTWHVPEELEAAEPSGAMVIELAPMAASPTETPSDLAPGAEQVASEARPMLKPEEKQPDEVPDLPPASNPDAVVERPAQAETEVAPQPQAAAPVTTAPAAVSEQKAPTATAPAQGRPDAKDSGAVVTWRTQLLASIERNKRYPEAARSRHEQGVTQVSFTLDRRGFVVAARLTQSSGAPALDGEALALLKRAQPFPAPPAALPGDVVLVRLPIRFTVK